MLGSWFLLEALHFPGDSLLVSSAFRHPAVVYLKKGAKRDIENELSNNNIFDKNDILVESRSWRDPNLKFGPNCDLEVDNFLFFSKLSTSRSQFVGQILNSDLASSYFLFNTPTERSRKKNLVLKEKFGFSKKNLE